MYEVNTTTRSYSSNDAADVADVAVAWKKAGKMPRAYAKLAGENGYAIKIVEVPVTTKKATKAALLAAK